MFKLLKVDKIKNWWYKPSAVDDQQQTQFFNDDYPEYQNPFLTEVSTGDLPEISKEDSDDDLFQSDEETEFISFKTDGLKQKDANHDFFLSIGDCINSILYAGIEIYFGFVYPILNIIADNFTFLNCDLPKFLVNTPFQQFFLLVYFFSNLAASLLFIFNFPVIQKFIVIPVSSIFAISGLIYNLTLLDIFQCIYNVLILITILIYYNPFKKVQTNGEYVSLIEREMVDKNIFSIRCRLFVLLTSFYNPFVINSLIYFFDKDNSIFNDPYASMFLKNTWIINFLLGELYIKQCYEYELFLWVRYIIRLLLFLILSCYISILVINLVTP